MDHFPGISEYIDEYGFPCHRTEDGSRLEGGDSSNRWGLIRIIEKVAGVKLLPNDPHEDIESIYRLKEHQFVRHPDITYWYGKPGCMSHDNFMPLMIGAYLCGCVTEARYMAMMLIERFGFFWNIYDIAGDKKKIPIPDLAFPGTWSTLFRVMNWWMLYPIMVVFDLWYLFQAIIICVIGIFNKEHTTDDLVLQCNFIFAQEVMPTPISFLARWVYCHFRPLSHVTTEDKKSVVIGEYGPMSAFESYFYPRTAIKIAWYWMKIVQRYF